ncbi:MAG TPA: universal stress protein [Planctomycetota bacterium]|nr:universal stress protein [Planctomycetota bacterium]
MIKHVLVPLDGSRLAESVLDPVVQLVRSSQGSILLLHAVTPAESFAMTASEFVTRERRHSARYLARLSERLGDQGIGVEERVVTGEPSRVIVATASREKVDLIAMSTHGRSGVREWAFGSVAERVLRSTGIPTLIFWGKLKGRFAIRRILVPLDGSPRAMAVLDAASDLADSLMAELLLVHVGKRLPEAVERACQGLERRHTPHQVLMGKGDPSSAILEIVRKESPDLIAMTPTGESRHERIHFGRVAEEILRRAERPILLVRPQEGK